MKSLRSRRTRIAVESLEDRCTPATSGIAWPNGQQMTLSFVPDGTQVSTYKSSLFQTLNAATSTTAWQQEILRAFETWAQCAELNVGVVPDGGQPLGASGAVQGDARFGDIRIAAAPLAAGTLITNTAFQWSGTTWSGDVVVNSNYHFNIGGTGGAYDLYTAMLDEAGNVFGVLDSRTDTASGAFYQYVGAKAGIDANDIAAIQALYGPRTADGFDSIHANEAITNASMLGNNPQNLNLIGDITTSSDVDYYAINAPPKTASVSIALTTSGVSALQGKLQLYDNASQLVGLATSSNPLAGDLTITFNNLQQGTSYYIGVSSNALSGSPFGVGAYHLSIVYTFTDGTTSAQPTGIPAPHGHTMDSIAKASSLVNPTDGLHPTGKGDFYYKGAIDDSTDVDYFKVQNSCNDGAWKMNLLVWAQPGSNLLPQVHVFDKTGTAVAFNILNNAGGSFSLETPSVDKSATYYVEVSAAYPISGQGTGAFVLAINFNTLAPTAVTKFTDGSLTATANQQIGSFAVRQNQLLNFMLTANGGSAGTELRMDIRDVAGNIVFSLNTYAGQQTRTGQVYLTAGVYSTTYTAIAPVGQALSPISFDVRVQLISDPIGPRYTANTTPFSGTDMTSSALAYTGLYYF